MPGTAFAVWAPHARQVAVVGPWNHWDVDGRPLAARSATGVWAGFVAGHRLAHAVQVRRHRRRRRHPAARRSDGPVRRAQRRDGEHRVRQPARLGRRATGWRARPHGDPVADRHQRVRGAPRVVAPAPRRPLPRLPRAGAAARRPRRSSSASPTSSSCPWPSTPTSRRGATRSPGSTRPTSRFGDPDDFRWFVDHLHQRGLGVIVDWVPAHFPRDEGALARFDGTPLYEHADPRRAEHPDWGTLVFDHGRPEVRGFLIANALYWLGELHVDGLRVDAVASMLYLDYSRGDGRVDAERARRQRGPRGRRVPPGAEHGRARACSPGVLTIAEESTAWPGVSRPVDAGGLGFTHKWNMGWMHDTLDYWSTDPLHRRDAPPPAHLRAHLRVGRALRAAAEPRRGRAPQEAAARQDAGRRRPRRGSPTCARSTRGCGRTPASSCCSWAASWPTRASGRHERGPRLEPARRRRATPASQRLVGDLNAIQAHHPALFASDGDPAGLRVARRRRRRAERPRLRAPRCRAPTTSSSASPTSRASTPRATGSGWPARAGGAGLVTTDDARYGGAGSWVPHLEAEPTPWQDRDHSAVLTIPPLTVLYLVPGPDEPTSSLHGHFYQPPREDPWTGVVPEQPTAAPFHDWNERITAECYRPNTAVAVADGDGPSLVVNTFEHLSFNVGPTLLSWLEAHHPDVYGAHPRRRRRRGPGHRAGLRARHPPALQRARPAHPGAVGDRRLRPPLRSPPGRACGCPETAVSDAVLLVLAEEGIRFTILAPRPDRRGAADRGGAADAHVAARRGPDPVEPTVGDPVRSTRAGPTGGGTPSGPTAPSTSSSTTAPSPTRSPSPGPPATTSSTPPSDRDGLVAAATDGETFGHHHPGAERDVAHALTVGAPARGVRTPRLVDVLDERPPDARGAGARSAPGRAPTASTAGRPTAAATRAAPTAGTRPGGRRCAQALDVLRDWGVERRRAARARRSCATRGRRATTTSAC